MRLEKVTDPGAIKKVLDEGFSFDVPSNISVLLHEIRIDGQTVGYVATEDYNTVGGPHIYVREGFKSKPYLTKIGWLFKNVYCPLMKSLGKEFLVTNCDESDSGTSNFLKKCGFSLKRSVVAEYKL